MPTKFYTYSTTVEVTDPRELRRLAEQEARKNLLWSETVCLDVLGPAEDPNVDACIRLLLNSFDLDIHAESRKYTSIEGPELLTVWEALDGQ